MLSEKGSYAPHALKRVGKKGEDKWEEIPYEQALDEIAAKLKELKDDIVASKSLRSSKSALIQLSGCDGSRRDGRNVRRNFYIRHCNL